MTRQRLYRFDDFEIDPARRQICLAGVSIPVSQRAFQLLLYLLENPGRILTKTELMKAVWPQASVEESNLTQNIFLLRKALGEHAGQYRYIVTVAGEGYQFAVRPLVVEAGSFPEAQGEPEPGDRALPLESREPESRNVDAVRESSLARAEAPVSTWKRPSILRRWWLAGAAVVALLVVAGTLAAMHYLPKKQSLAGDGRVVIADFDNTTGDAAFNSALREGLASQLEQSPYLALVSDGRIAQTMKMMEQPKGTRLTDDLARQVCERMGGAAVIEGSIASLGQQYVLGLKAISCKGGDLIAQDQETANSKESVLQALGTAAGRLRRKLGESLPSLQKYDAPPADVTTGSLEALEAYGLGIQAQLAGSDCATAVAFFKKAVALDPGFAMAYAHQGVCDSSEEGVNATKKAYSLKDKVSDREKYYIASHYEQYATGNLQAARKILEDWAATYPHDNDPGPNLLKLYLTTGEYEQALPVVQSIVQSSPGTPGSNASRLATTLLFLNRVEEAKAVLLDTETHHNDGPVHHYFLYEIDFLQNDSAGMAKEASYLHSQKGWLGNILELESVSASYFGKFTLARSLSDQAVQVSQREQDKEGMAGTLAEASLQEALAGNALFAEKKAKAALALSKSSTVEVLAGFALALGNNQAEATRTMEEMNRQSPTDTLVQAAVATIRATVALGNGQSPDQARRAVDVLAPAVPYSMSGNLYLVPLYVRGRAYMASGQSASAAADFRTILDHYGVTRNFVTGPMARLELARAEEQGGDKAKARADYGDFLRLWRDADADLVPLKAARASLQKLGN